MHQLIICEKPKVAEKVANAIAEGGVERKGDGGVSYYEVERHGKQIIVAAAAGHLYSLSQRKGGSGYPVFDIEWAPAYEVSKESGFTKAYVKMLEKLGKGADELINSCDFDLEGSLIGYNVMRFACKKETGTRMKFSALTPEDLLEAYENRSELDFGNVEAAEARHILDWFYGINLSRALMQAIRRKGEKRVMSIGRVQGPALSILARKEREIASFKPVPYWEVSVKCKKTKFLNTRGRFESESGAREAERRTKLDGIVSKLERSEFPQKPNPPFDLTSLQAEAYRCLGLPPSRTLQIAQSLYEASLISYPRTASQQLPKKLGLPGIIAKLEKNEKYSELARKLIANKQFTPREGSKTDPAHPAIHPTGILARGLETGAEKIYDLIARRFLACFAEDAIRERMKVELALGEENYDASGTRTMTRGWFDFYGPYVRVEEKELPSFVEKEKVKASKPEVERKETQPPRRFTQASIIEELESRGLGTKATRSVIIDTLYKRGYVKERNLTVTPFGLSVFDTLGAACPEITDEELTHNIEADMEEIAAGNKKKDEVIDEGKEVVKKILAEINENEERIGLDLVSSLRTSEVADNILGDCRECDGKLRMLRGRTGSKFVGCSNYPKCTSSFPLPQKYGVAPTTKVCEKCKTPIVRVFWKGGKGFDMCLDTKCETKKNWGKKKETKKEESPPTGEPETKKKAEAKKEEKNPPRKESETGTKKVGKRKTEEKSSPRKESETKKEGEKKEMKLGEGS